MIERCTNKKYRKGLTFPSNIVKLFKLFKEYWKKSKI